MLICKVVVKKVPFCLDYLPIANTNKGDYMPGALVKVPFRNTEVIGVLVEIIIKETEKTGTYKKIKRVLSICKYTLPLQCYGAFIQSFCTYYGIDIAEFIHLIMPGPAWTADRNRDLGFYEACTDRLVARNHLTKTGWSLHDWLVEHGPSYTLDIYDAGFKGVTLRQCEKKKMIKKLVNYNLREGFTGTTITLSNEQAQIIKKITDSASGSRHYVFGVTGSGKSYLYFALARAALLEGKQVLLLVPEIGLTPQLQLKISQYFPKSITAILHSALSENQRWCVWNACQQGVVRLLVGTRSALFAPFRSLGLIIVDEEHDLSYKQMSQVRYSARGAAFMRAKSSQAKIILGSATPSLSCLHHINSKQINAHQLKARYGAVAMPEIITINTAGKKLMSGLSHEALSQITADLSSGRPVLIFLNRRGFAPSYWCPSCNQAVVCKGCTRPYTYHQGPGVLSCHHCQLSIKVPQQCPSCKSGSCVPVGQGTEKVERFLQVQCPTTSIIRMDKDTCGTWQKTQDILERIHRPGAKIIIATQMLVKGHHIEDLDLVVVLGADHALYSKDFRAQEFLLSQMAQVSGRSGRSKGKGRVLIQTAHTQHVLWKYVISHRYRDGADYLLAQRGSYILPPFVNQLAIHFAHKDGEYANNCLKQMLHALPQEAQENSVGPMLAALPMLGGLNRRVLVLQSVHSGEITSWISVLRWCIKSKKICGVVLDRDPVEI